jgi:hypothetical protein
MQATRTWLGALLLAGTTASLAHADPCYFPCVRQAPDMCGPGFYAPNGCGCLRGPNYCVRPPFEPFNGMFPLPQRPPTCPPGAAGAPTPSGVVCPPYYAPYAPPCYIPPGCPPPNATAIFPTHPFARSPRDFFMVD